MPRSTTSRLHSRASACEVFVSYAEQDEDAAERFTTWCETALKLRCFCAARSVRNSSGSPTLQAQIESAAKSCKVAVVLVTSRSVKSQWVACEIGYLRAHGVAIVPVQIPENLLPPLIFKILGGSVHRNWADNKARRAAITDIIKPFSPKRFSDFVGLLKSAPCLRAPEGPNDDDSHVKQSILYHPEFPSATIAKAMAAAKSEICLLQTWTSQWNEYTTVFEKVLGLRTRQRKLPPTDLSIRIILIHPRCRFAEQRGRHSGSTRVGQTTKAVKFAIDGFTDWKKQWKLPNRTIEVRLSRELPTFAMIAVDERLFFTPYLRKRNTLRLPAIELNSAKNEIDLYFREHFDGLWRVSTPATHGSDTP